MWRELSPGDIEKESFEIIRRELAEIGAPNISEKEKWVLWRVIHATADFEYAKNLRFLNNAYEAAEKAFESGSTIVTDTNMALSGISKPMLKRYGINAICLTADEGVSKKAAELGVTRSSVAIEQAALLDPNAIFVIGNAPTALFRLCELIDEGKAKPRLVVGCPVGFVNVVQSKEEISRRGVPAIVAMGRKGGSNVAAAIVNAIMYGEEASGVGGVGRDGRAGGDGGDGKVSGVGRAGGDERDGKVSGDR